MLLVCILYTTACEESKSTDSGENSAPGSFTITTSDIEKTSAVISWTAPEDADGDALTYDVNLGSDEVASSQPGTSFTFSGLTAGTDYSGSVVAMDGNGGESNASFSFTTDNEDGSSNENENPGSFTVTVSDLTHNRAELSWTAAADPDGDAVTYAITLDSDELESAESATSYSLTDLASGMAFSGKVTASDGNGGTSEASFSFTSYVIDISLYKDMFGFESATLVDCNYSEGGSGQCYQIKFSSNPIDDEGPYCPETTFDVGGFGNYDGTTNPGFQVMKAALFQAMETDGYDIIADVANGDGSYDITIETVVPGGGRTAMPASAACLEPTPDDNLTLTFEIPVVPTDLSSADNIESVEFVGLALDGVPINGAPPSVVSNNGKIPSLDRCGGHHDPSGYYHWHFIAAYMDATLDAQGLLDKDNDIQCSKKDQEATVLMGYARDGYPIYSGQDSEGVDPTDLDSCNGHMAATGEYPDGIYHYHASTDVTNVPPCIVGKQSVDAFAKPS